MLRLRNLISHKIFIHCMVALGIFALWGYLVTDNKYIILGVALSFLGAICGAFIKTIDSIKIAK
jgi:hypothetical protein